jgi:outer membrane protein with beta-barrel domain
VRRRLHLVLCDSAQGLPWRTTPRATALTSLPAPVGLFGAATVSRTEYDDIDGGGTVADLTAGYAIDLTPSKSVQFCPQAGFAYQSGPDIDTGFGTVSTSAHAFALGGSFGGSIPASPTLDFVPFAGAAYTISRTSVGAGGNSISDSEDYVALTLGAGFVINRALTLQPSVAIPIGLEGGKSSFQLAFAYNFGSTSPRR